jgi:ubiquinone/menaquinone biosynthesis C-methylase UbiE
MGIQNRFPGTTRDLLTRREAYFLRYLAFALALLMVGYGLWQGLPGIVVIGLAFLTLSALLLGLQFWTAHRLYDFSGLQTSGHLFEMSQARPGDKLLTIDLGSHEGARLISKHLTNGKLFVVDLYNPQQTPNPAVARARRTTSQTASDPRIIWYNGSVNLLPLPDHSVRAVFLQEVLSEFVQEGDRKALLQEVVRVLEPNGRVVLAELTDAWPNRLRGGFGSPQIKPSSYWTNLLTASGLQMTREDVLQDLMLCLRADKISPYSGRQLALGLAFPAN